MSAIKIIGKLNPKQYSEMLDHLTRKKIKNPFIKAKDIVVDKKPEVEQTEMFNRFNKANPRQDLAGGGMLVQPGFGGTRQGYKGLEKFEIEKINNPSQEALDEISSIIDKYTKTSDVAGKKVKHLSKDGPVDQIFKQIKTKGYKRPSIAKPLFARILKEKGITTYDNYRTNKIVFTLQNVLRQNKGDILSIKPSAVAEILPEFAIEGNKGGKGLPAFRTFLNYLEGSQRLADRSGLQVPKIIAGKPVDQLVNELKQNFLDVPGGRARGNFTVFEETKLLDKIANENPKVKALDLKTLYEEAGGTNFRQRLLGLVPAKTGSGYTKESVKKFGVNILDKVKEGVISNSLPESLKAAFKTYASSFNQARFLAEADKFRKSNPELAYRFVNAANIVAGKARRIGLTGAGEHALPVSAIKTANAPVETLLQIDAYVDPEINNWKAKNFDEAIFSSNNGLAVQYKKAKGAEKKAIQTEIMGRLAFMKKKAPDLMKNVKFDFTNGIFTASSTTKAIDKLNETELKQLGTKGQTIRNFFLKEMPDAVTINPETKRIISIKDSYIPITQSLTEGRRVVPPKLRPGQGGFIATELIPGVTKTSRRIIGGAAGFVLPEVLFYQLDKRNRMSKGVSEEEAEAAALQSASLGALKDTAYMNNLKKVGESMGVDSRSFDAAYDMNVLLKNYEQNNLNFQDQYLNLLETGDEKRASDLEKNFNEYKKRTQNKYSLLANNISDNVMNTVGASPLIMEQGRKNITQEQFEKPFKDLQKAGLEKLKREKIKAAPTQKRQVDTTAGSIGEDFYQAFDSLTQGAKNLLQGRVIPFASKIGLPQYEPQASQREILSDTLQNLSDRDLERFNLGRGYVQSDPVSDLDLQNLAAERPGLFYAGGGIAKLAGVDSGPPPEKGPMSQGLQGLMKRVRNL